MARVSSIFTLVVVYILLIFDTDGASATPTPEVAAAGQPKCHKIKKRQEWDQLSNKDKANYIKAVQCLQKKPGNVRHQYGVDRLTRYEDFVFQHKTDGPGIHWVGHFLPWHRYFGHLYEKALREECRYTGAQPYWDHSRDVTSLRTEDMFADSPLGFGGDGIKLDVPPFPRVSPPGTGGGCITTGPFKDYIIRIPRKNLIEPDGGRCLERNFNTWVLNEWAKPSDVERILKHDKYWDFAHALEGGTNNFTEMGLHGAGHAAIGGMMGDAWTSNVDPLFYLHHANMDRIWDKWQRMDWEKRSKEIGGSTKPFTQRMAPDMFSITEKNVTLDMEIPMSQLGRTVKIEELMDTRAWPLCYEYDDDDHHDDDHDDDHHDDDHHDDDDHDDDDDDAQEH